MSIEVVCECGQRMRAKDSYAGKTAPCRHCGAIVSIPNPILVHAPKPTSFIPLEPAPEIKDEASHPLDLSEISLTPLSIKRAERPRNHVIAYVGIAISAFGLGFALGFGSQKATPRQPVSMAVVTPEIKTTWDASNRNERAKLYVNADADVRLALLEHGEVLAFDSSERKEYRSLLSKLKTIYSENPVVIADAINSTVIDIQKKGLRASQKELLEMFAFYYDEDPKTRGRKRDLNGDLAIYTTFRFENYSHSAAVMSFVILERAVTPQ